MTNTDIMMIILAIIFVITKLIICITEKQMININNKTINNYKKIEKILKEELSYYE